MIKSFLAGAITAGALTAGVAFALPNPSPYQCYAVGRDVVENDPTFVEPDPKIDDLSIFLICGENDPGEAPGEVVQRDSLFQWHLSNTDAEVVGRAIDDWRDRGMIEPESQR